MFNPLCQNVLLFVAILQQGVAIGCFAVKIAISDFK